ncbi:LysR family transcriptional regulator [Oricola cellulosilytica]|uniref:LysR family transcriptional regulator n=1 Tax=Oricola cellulosilytica TaxID=1429082 RepID=A0A4V6N6C7_9HYPH|nr:LysR family transcriptional regulator [Oricola cellulosilytica]TCD16152.1 LysR family transcriptional regulator [Oricola cellulosilytica]
MDTELARTFLEIVTSGSFLSASKRLHVTQSTVSLRVKRLEELLGTPVFIRNKAGAELTPAGEQFERFARSMLKVWEEARYQVAVPEGFERSLIVGSQYSLWPKFSMRWLRLLERLMPDIALRAEMGVPDGLIRMMLDGVLDIAVMYTPQLRPGLEVEVIMEDSLVLASSDPENGGGLDTDYIFIDWGPEFVQAHKTYFPDFRASHVTLSLGTLSARYVIEHQRSAYFPARFIEDEVEEGTLHVVRDAPVFPFPVYAVWHSESDTELVERALTTLRRVAGRVEEDQAELLEEAGVEPVSMAPRLVDIIEDTDQVPTGSVPG